MTALAILLTVLQVWDGWTTYRILKRGGREKNRLMREFMERFGIYPTLLAAKGGAALLVWVLVLLPTVDRLTETLQWIGLVSLGTFYVWVAWNNWKELRD